MFDKIDSNNDTYVTAAELLAWIKFVHRRFVSEDVVKQMAMVDKNRDSFVSWEEYYNHTYSHLIGETCFLFLLMWPFFLLQEDSW